MYPLLYHYVALAAPPLDALGERLQIDVKAFVLFQAEQQVGRALQQAGQQPWALRKGCRLAEKVSVGDSPAVQRYAITGDGQPFAGIQALGQFQHGCGVEFTDLDQAQIARPGFVQQTIETLGVAGVDQHIHCHPAPHLRQCPADFQIAQVRADQQLATRRI